MVYLWLNKYLKIVFAIYLKKYYKLLFQPNTIFFLCVCVSCYVAVVIKLLLQPILTLVTFYGVMWELEMKTVNINFHTDMFSG